MQAKTNYTIFQNTTRKHFNLKSANKTCCLNNSLFNCDRNVAKDEEVAMQMVEQVVEKMPSKDKNKEGDERNA